MKFSFCNPPPPPHIVRKNSRFPHGKYEEWLWTLLFVGPTVAGIYIFFIYPVFDSIYISLTKWNHLSRRPEFISLANYIRLFKHPQVLKKLFNTLFYVVTIVPVPAILVFSLLLANALNLKTSLIGLSRAAFFSALYAIACGNRHGMAPHV
jgi:multiple sugar transport system permease protein